MERKPTHEVIDRRTGRRVGTYISLITAFRAANRRNRNCGEERFFSQPIQGGPGEAA